MTDQSFTTTFDVNRPVREVYDAVIDPRAWWSTAIQGRADEVGAVFVFDSGDHHCWRLRVIETVPGERIVWRVFDSTTGFVANRGEWDGTEVRFDLSAWGEGTRVCFTHAGLTPDLECFGACSTGWTGYITASLPRLLTAGQGEPGRY